MKRTLAFAFYDPETGKITGTQTGLEEPHIEEYRRRGIVFAHTYAPFSGATHYVKDGELVARDKMECSLSSKKIMADGVDSSILSGVPSGVVVEINGVEHVSDGSDIVLTTTEPDTYYIRIDELPYEAVSFEVEAR